MSTENVAAVSAGGSGTGAGAAREPAASLRGARARMNAGTPGPGAR